AGPERDRGGRVRGDRRDAGEQQAWEYDEGAAAGERVEHAAGDGDAEQRDGADRRQRGHGGMRAPDRSPNRSALFGGLSSTAAGASTLGGAEGGTMGTTLVRFLLVRFLMEGDERVCRVTGLKRCSAGWGPAPRA